VSKIDFKSCDSVKEQLELFDAPAPPLVSNPSYTLSGVPWMQTATGKRFYPTVPEATKVDIEDIALSLAKICRFGGHSTNFYSVAQHSIMVSKLVPKKYALVGLLHDATEAYLGDIVTPLKQALPNFVELEKRLFKVIAKEFSICNKIPKEVKEADMLALSYEARALMPNRLDGWDIVDERPCPFGMTPWDWRTASYQFLRRFDMLMAGEKEIDYPVVASPPPVQPFAAYEYIVYTDTYTDDSGNMRTILSKVKIS